MDDARWTHLKDDLARLLDLDAADRAAALDALAPDARREIERWLRIGDEAAGFLGTPAAAAGDLDAVVEAVGDGLGEARVGPYRIVDRIGRGGMGDVFLAERADGLFEQRVALKRIRRGGDSAAVLARFADERRILARLRHPGIARLLDAGVDEDGQPWIAMDYVRGVALTEAAAGQPVAERVRLLAEVAATVHAAHQALVVHRDLKPSNVLVAPGDDGLLHPTLLDFGIAKVLDPDDDHVDTASGVRPMTRAYAAPEQVRGDPTTTATDVHALGVLLYEVLTGERPYRGASATAVESAIVSVDPTLPSRAVTDAAPTDTVGTTTPSSGTGSGTTTSGARPRELRGDLDTICLKALRKSPAERYASAEAFEADLRRYLEGLPIAARPPSALYRARKFVGRHPLGVGAAVGVLVAVLAGSLLYTSRITHERDRAEAARTEAVAAADFLSSLLLTANPFETTRRDTLRLSDLLEEAVARVDRLDGQPALQARLYEPLAVAYGGLARYGLADSLFRRASARLARGAPADRARVGVRHGDLLVLWGGDERQAEAIGLYRAALALPGGLTDTTRAEAYYKAAIALNRNGDPAAADAAFGEALAVYDRLGVPDTASYAVVLGQRSVMLSDAGRDDEAVAAITQALELMTQALGPDHPQVAVEHYVRGLALLAAARPADALAAFEASRRIDAAVLGADHPNTLDGDQMAAVAMHELGRSADAAARLGTATAQLEAALGPADPRLPFYLQAYGVTLLGAGRLDDADRALARGLGLMQRIHGADHWGAGLIRGQQGRVALARGDARVARAALTEGIGIVEAALGAGSHKTQRLRVALGEALLADGQARAARRTLAPLAAAYATRYGPRAPRTREVEALLERASPR